MRATGIHWKQPCHSNNLTGDMKSGTKERHCVEEIGILTLQFLHNSASLIGQPVDLDGLSYVRLSSQRSSCNLWRPGLPRLPCDPVVGQLRENHIVFWVPLKDNGTQMLAAHCTAIAMEFGIVGGIAAILPLIPNRKIWMGPNVW